MPLRPSFCSTSLIFAAILVLLRVDAGGASLSAQLNAIFAPSRVQRSAIAPDGRHVAFAVDTGRALELQIFTIDRPELSTSTAVAVSSIKTGDAKPAQLDVPLHVPFDSAPGAETRFLGWASNETLVASTGTVVLSTSATGLNPVRLEARALAPSSGPKPRLEPTTRVLAVLPDANSVVLEISQPLGAHPQSGEVNLTVVRRNLYTGESIRLLDRVLPAPGGSVLLDPQGQPRIVFTRGTFPRRFDLLAGNGANSSGQPLDHVLTDREVFSSDITPANLLGHRSIPLGFGVDSNLLYFASNLRRYTYGIYQADLRTGKRTAVVLEKDLVDLASLDAPGTQSPLVFDRKTRALVGVRVDGLEPFTHWLDPELGAVQAELAQKFPGRTVTVVDWDDVRRHFVFTASSATDPGRSFVFDRADGRCLEYFRHANLNPDDTNASTLFAFDAPGGARLTGYITLPHAAPVKKPGLVIWFHDGPLQRISPGYQREAQALAALGFAVAQLNYRGSVGAGVSLSDAQPDRIDRQPAEDAVALVAWLGSNYAIDTSRVSTFGEGRGGYLALRTLQLHPDLFRCAVAINADLNPARRLTNAREKDSDSATTSAVTKQLAENVQKLTATTSVDFSELDPAHLDQILDTVEKSFVPREGETKFYTFEESDALRFSREFIQLTTVTSEKRNIAVDTHPELLTRPIFLLHDPAHVSSPIAPVRLLREALKRRKAAPEYSELPAPYSRGDPSTRASTFTRIARFLNGNFYDDVKPGELLEKP